MTTKTFIPLSLCAFGLSLVIASVAMADEISPNEGQVAFASEYDPPHGFAIGLGVGSPTGLTLELNSGWRHSFEAAVGGDVLGDDGAYGHLVYKLGVTPLYRGESVWMPLYVGIGGFAQDASDAGIDLGVRLPVGVNFNFRNAPVQAFLEVALLATVFDNGDDGGNWAGVGGYGGFRIWL